MIKNEMPFLVQFKDFCESLESGLAAGRSTREQQMPPLFSTDYLYHEQIRENESYFLQKYELFIRFTITLLQTSKMSLQSGLCLNLKIKPTSTKACPCPLFLNLFGRLIH